MEEKVELYSASQVKDILSITESTYRTILRTYRDYIISRKANKNKDLFPSDALEVFGSIYRMRKMGYTKTEIIKEIKKTPQYIQSRIKDGHLKENQDLVEIMSSDSVPELVNKFVDRFSQANRQIQRLRKDLDKRTESYQNEITQLKDKINTNEEKTNENMSKMLKTIWKLEEELKEYKNQTLFQRIKSLFGL